MEDSKFRVTIYDFENKELILETIHELLECEVTDKGDKIELLLLAEGYYDVENIMHYVLEGEGTGTYKYEEYEED